MSLSLLLAVPSLSFAGRIDLRIDAPVEGLGKAWPIYVGVPMPQGELRDVDEVAVVDGGGREVASQRRVLARWVGDGSVRWIGVDFNGDPKGEYQIWFADDARQARKSRGARLISVDDSPDGWLITTGSARFLVPSKGPLIARAWLQGAWGGFSDKSMVLSSDDGELYVTDQHGRTAWSGVDSEPDSFVMEPALGSEEAAAGLKHLAVRREGWYSLPDGERLARHITRIHFYAGQSFVRIEHTLVLSRNTNTTPWLGRYYMGALEIPPSDLVSRYRDHIPPHYTGC